MERGNKWALVFFLSTFLGLIVLNAESVKRTAYFLLATIGGETITGSETYTSSDELIVTNTTVEPGGSLTLKAKNKITLGPGFHAKPGSQLTASIDPGLSGFHLTSMPPTTGNDRFLNEIYPEMTRPGLSIIGFDNGGDNSKGYG